MSATNRRIFLKIAAAGFISFFVFIWNKLTFQHINSKGSDVSSIPLNKNKEVQFVDNYIVVNSDQTTTVFSSHCSHLGCKINTMENGKLVCPCHGSEYKLDGTVIKGPAYKNLEIISSSISDDGNNIIING